MRIKTFAALVAVPSLVLTAGNSWAETSAKTVTNQILPPLIIEIAGASETDRATDKQLRDAGTQMIPSEDLKQAKPKVAEPSVKKLVKEKRQPQSMPVKPAPAKPSMPMQRSKPEQPMQMQATLSGPYLRLDAGYAINSNSDGTQSAGNLSSGSVDNVFLLGGGVGYRFSDNLRADVSLDYRLGADVSATTAGGNTTTTDVSAISVMLNAYWDITTYEQLTPYIGAGLGYAYLSTSDQTTTGGIATEAGATSNNLAWSLMAGAAYEIVENTSLDMGYRFINLGSFSQSVSTSYNDLMAHELRAGLRFSF